MHSSEFLRRAIALAARARDAGDHPFGALLVVDGEVVAEALNLVNTTHDLTAHAETVLIRILERDGRLGMLAVGTVYASCEPCPMCVGAMFWAGARHVVFGLSAARLNTLTTNGELFGFTITAHDILAGASPAVSIEGPLLEDEAAVPHQGFWIPTRTD